MMPTPNVYADDHAPLFVSLPEHHKSNEVELVFLTDRTPENDETGKLTYGYGRSNSLAMGTVVVNLGDRLKWEDLSAASVTRTRAEPINLTLGQVVELARFPATPPIIQLIDGKVQIAPGYAAKRRAATDRATAALTRRLEMTSKAEVFLFVHGYHNTFADSAFAMGELWHFLGREGVPIVYSWPAGYPGLFGYTYDSESSEFTVHHLKNAIRWLAAVPGLKKIHLIAHSRGADSMVSAVRELVIWANGAGLNPANAARLDQIPSPS